MRYIRRDLEKYIIKASKGFTAVILTGPRRTGKTTLLKKCFPNASYVLLEDPDILQMVREDPRAFLDDLKLPVILDEIQNAPLLLNYIRSRIDQGPKRYGQWLITGSQEFSLMEGVTESMAGRAAVLELLSFSAHEHNKVTCFKGGFPESLAKPSQSELWFKSYIQTYLERDVRSIVTVKDLPVFRKFLSLLASRVGQMLNRTDLAAPLGVSIPTISQWLHILEITKQVLLIGPYFENFGKRLVKSPKIYFSDCGLLCHLLGMSNEASLIKSTFYGPVFENFVVTELAKQQINSGHRMEVYYYRDQRGLEVDFVVPRKAKELDLLEVKATKTPLPQMTNALLQARRVFKTVKTRLFLVCRPTISTIAKSPQLVRDVRILSPAEYIALYGGRLR